MHFLARVADPYATISYAQEGEDVILQRLFDNADRGFYVDVGAHHPYRFSNTCCFHRRGWRGINIDANPAAIDEFRRHRPSDVNLCVGIAEAAGSLTFFRFNDSALDTFDPVLAAERSALPAYRLIDRSEVTVRRLDDVLTEHLPKGQTIDILSVDAEGLDLQVLKSNDWARFRPRVLLVEARGADIDALSAEPSCAFARTVGYKPVAKTANTAIFADRTMA
ncbi:MAG TPA: FkbM family methyltransferase [Pseudolabrys sp.]|nr:FkbM family methyltransferase [Pseudolabrys sp.]